MRTTTSWAALPVETKYHILCLLDPRDLIRLRTVSVPFCAIVDDPALWRTIYATARLLLPPGPFTWQSTRFLQRALVHSARVASTWTTQPLVHVSARSYIDPQPPHTINDQLQWVCGRWLIATKDMNQLRVHDVEGGSERVLWDHGSFGSWDSASVMSERGHFIYVVVHLRRGRLVGPVKLLQFIVDDDTGHWLGPETFDVPTWCFPREVFMPNIRIDSGIAPYVLVSLDSMRELRHSLVFDPRCRRFYKFPRFRTRLDILLNYPGPWLPPFVEVHFTRTHLLVVSRCYLTHGGPGESEIIQTFTLPDVDDVTHAPPNSAPNSSSESVPASASDLNGDRPIVHELRLTHEMATHNPRSIWFAPIRDSTVDPITHATTLRFMHTYASPDMQTRHVCIDYILPASRSLPISASTSAADDRSPNATSDSGDGENDNNNADLNAIIYSVEDVPQITTAWHDIFSVEALWHANLVDVSNNGFVRGLCVVFQHDPEGWSRGHTRLVYKFSVDTTGELCVAVVGDPSASWKVPGPQQYYGYSLDGVRGRVWRTVEERNLDGDGEEFATVVDFQ